MDHRPDPSLDARDDTFWVMTQSRAAKDLLAGIERPKMFLRCAQDDTWFILRHNDMSVI